MCGDISGSRHWDCLYHSEKPSIADLFFFYPCSFPVCIILCVCVCVCVRVSVCVCVCVCICFPMSNISSLPFPRTVGQARSAPPARRIGSRSSHAWAGGAPPCRCPHGSG